MGNGGGGGQKGTGQSTEGLTGVAEAQGLSVHSLQASLQCVNTILSRDDITKLCLRHNECPRESQQLCSGGACLLVAMESSQPLLFPKTPSQIPFGTKSLSFATFIIDGVVLSSPTH